MEANCSATGSASRSEQLKYPPPGQIKTAGRLFPASSSGESISTYVVSVTSFLPSYNLITSVFKRSFLLFFYHSTVIFSSPCPSALTVTTDFPLFPLVSLFSLLPPSSVLSRIRSALPW